VISEDVHLVATTGEKLEDQPDGDGRAASLKEGLRGEQEDSHRSPALRPSADVVQGSVLTSTGRGVQLQQMSGRFALHQHRRAREHSRAALFAYGRAGALAT
jgi:hypothetical protein